MSTWGTVYELERAKATGQDPDSLRAKIKRLEKALIEIEYHSNDKNAAATARAALSSRPVNLPECKSHLCPVRPRQHG